MTADRVLYSSPSLHLPWPMWQDNTSCCRQVDRHMSVFSRHWDERGRNDGRVPSSSRSKTLFTQVDNLCCDQQFSPQQSTSRDNCGYLCNFVMPQTGEQDGVMRCDHDQITEKENQMNAKTVAVEWEY